MGIIAATLLFTGCKKGDKGDTGPQGQPGPAAQVQTFSVSTAWAHMGTVGQVGDGYSQIINCSAITSSVMSSGTILVYFSTSPSNICVAMPYSEPKGTYTRLWNYAYYSGQFEIDMQDSDMYTTEPFSQYGVLYFKVVIISAFRKANNPNINWSSYTDVKKAFNLKD